MRSNQALRGRAAMAALGAALIATTFGSASISAAQTGAGESERTTQLRVSHGVISYGERFRLGGSVPGNRGTALKVQFRPAGTTGWRKLRTLHTKRDGDFAVRLGARRTGSYRVVPRRGRISTRASIRVRAVATLHVGKHDASVGDAIAVTGKVRPGGSRKVKVVIKGSDKQLLTTKSTANGSFGLRWEPSTPGSFEVQAHVAGNQIAAGDASASRAVTAYRPALASWYGPGLYGNRTGCGQTLTPGILGVAHKSIPCGTKITFRYRGRTVRAPVIDRGPYVGSREFDLTEELKQRLGFGSTGIVYVNR